MNKTIELTPKDLRPKRDEFDPSLMDDFNITRERIWRASRITYTDPKGVVTVFKSRDKDGDCLAEKMTPKKQLEKVRDELYPADRECPGTINVNYEDEVKRIAFDKLAPTWLIARKALKSHGHDGKINPHCEQCQALAEMDELLKGDL